jgi:hypothetical protein
MLNDPTARFRDLGSDHHATRINTERNRARLAGTFRDACRMIDSEMAATE